MGDIAEMMLDGTICEACGTYIDEDGDGIPRYCSKECAKDRGAVENHQNQLYKPSVPKVSCPSCKRRVKPAGLKDHMRDAHGVQDTFAYRVQQNPQIAQDLFDALSAIMKAKWRPEGMPEELADAARAAIEKAGAA